MTVSIFITPRELEQFRAWVHRTAVAQALTLADARGYRRGWIAKTDLMLEQEARRRRITS